MGVYQCQNYALLFFLIQNSFGWYTIFIWVLKFFGNVQNLYAWYNITTYNFDTDLPPYTVYSINTPHDSSYAEVITFQVLK